MRLLAITPIMLTLTAHPRGLLNSAALFQISVLLK